MTKPIPDGYHTVTPYLAVNDAAAAIRFYHDAFGAQELYRIDAPGGRVGHAEIQIGDSRIMLADEYPEIGHFGPNKYGGTPVSICLYVENVDALFQQAIAAGATEVQPVTDKFYGDRAGSLRDPFGHLWHVMTHVEDVSPEEMDRRMKAQENAGG